MVKGGLSLVKKVKKSVLFYGFTFAVSGSSYIKLFEGKKKLKPRKPRDIVIIWDGKKHHARMSATGKRTYNGKKYPSAYRVLYGKGKNELKEKIQKTFISTYIKVMSEEKITDSNATEALKIIPLSGNKIKLEPFLIEETKYDKLFKEFIEMDVFGWLKYPKKKSMFLKPKRGWIAKNDLKKHKEKFVIYYLIDTKSRPKKLYIGSSEQPVCVRIGGRRPEIPTWNKFRYDVLKPEFSGFLKRIEFHTIISFAKLFKNKMGLPTLGNGEFILMNKAKGLKP